MGKRPILTEFNSAFIFLFIVCVPHEHVGSPGARIWSLLSNVCLCLGQGLARRMYVLKKYLLNK